MPIHLTGKAFRLLEVLVENRPNAVSKDVLQDQVWPDVFVSEANLTSLVTEVRSGIGATRPGYAVSRVSMILPSRRRWGGPLVMCVQPRQRILTSAATRRGPNGLV